MRLRSRRISPMVSAIRRRRIGGAVSCSVGLAGGIVVLFLAVRLVGGPLFYLVRGDGEEGVCEHGKGDMSVPGVPGADLVVVESDFILRGSETFFDRPSCSGHLNKFSKSRMVWVVA